MQNVLRICTNEEMRELDRIAETEFKIGPTLLMENAGRAATEILLKEYPEAGRTSEILVFAGKGNNAGDAFVVARHLLCLDRKVRVFHLSPAHEYKGATAENYQILTRMKAKMMALESVQELESFFKSSTGPFFAVDGLIGTGLLGDLEGIFYDVVQMINQHVAEIVSLDMPTGISGDTGAVLGVSVKANLTVSFGFPRLGHFLPPGAGRRGKLVNVDISLPAKFKKEGNKFLLLRSPMSQLLQARDRYGHKNSNGHCLLIGGSPGRVGAIVMASRACHRMGTGLVTVASWEDCSTTLMHKLPDEAMSYSLKMTDSDFHWYRQQLALCSSVVIGPGLGMRNDATRLIEEILDHYHGPLLIDADALNRMAEDRLFSRLVGRKAPTLLTPHPGEMSRILEVSTEEVVRDPVAAIRLCVEKTQAVVILKSAATLLSSPEGTLYLNHYPNDGMATAGSGDVLAGMIGGLLGQRMDAFSAAQLGIYLHSLAGDLASQKQGHRSMTATDIIANIGNAFQEIKDTDKDQEAEPRMVRLL